MGTVSEKPEVEGVKQLHSPKEQATMQKLKEENNIILQAQAIQDKRDKQYKEQEAIILAELEADYGLTKEKLEECKEAEKALADPEKDVKTLTDAMFVYQESNLSKAQLAFMAINSNSRANMNLRQIERMQKQVEGAEKQVEALMKLSAMTNSVKKEMIPPGPETPEGETINPPTTPGIEETEVIE